MTSLPNCICRGLKAAGFDSDRAARIAEAEDAIQASRYGAMIVDLGLPDGDGRNLVSSLRAKGDTTPVLMLTARGTTGREGLGSKQWRGRLSGKALRL